MPIYEYKGQLYELSTNDPAEAKRKIQARLGEGTPTLKERAKDVGKAFASAADVALNAVTGTLDVAAYPLARAYYGMSMPPAQAALRAQQETTSPKDIIGRSLGITQQPAYQAEATRRGTQAIGEVVAPVVEALSEQTGAPQQDVASVLGTLSAGVPMAGRAAIKPIQPVVKGFTEGVKRPEYQRTPTTAFAPLESTYVTKPVVERFMAATPEQRVAMLPEVEQGRRGSESLFSSPVDMLAKNLAPTDVAGQPLIPYSGMTRQAFGEQLGRDLSNRPLPTTAAGLGGAVVGGLLGGLPGAMIGGAIAPTARLGQMFALERLGKNAGFVQGFPEALAEAQQLAVKPQPTNVGSVAPNVQQPARIQQPISTENQMMLPLTSNIIPSPESFNLQPGPGMMGPKQASMEIAAQKLQETAGPVRPTTPMPTPAPAPSFRPSNVIKQEISQLDDAATNLRERALTENVKPDTPEGDIYRGELDKLTNNINLLQKELDISTKLEKDLAKKQQRQTRPIQPSNVSQMMLERDPNYERFTIKMPDDIKKGMDTKEATAAMLSGKGEWAANNYKYKMEEVGGGDTRLQVRKDNQVVYERYY